MCGDLSTRGLSNAYGVIDAFYDQYVYGGMPPYFGIDGCNTMYLAVLNRDPVEVANDLDQALANLPEGEIEL